MQPRSTSGQRVYVEGVERRSIEWFFDEASDLVWREDDATTSDPDHESLEGAWRRIFGRPFRREESDDRYDGGDCTLYRFFEGIIAVSGYPGVGEIRLLKECRVPAGSQICPEHRRSPPSFTGVCWRCPPGTLPIPQGRDLFIADVSGEDVFSIKADGVSLFDRVEKGGDLVEADEAEIDGDDVDGPEVDDICQAVHSSVRAESRVRR